MRHFIFSTGLFVSLTSLALVHGQENEFYKKPTNTKDYWRAVQFEIGLGKFDIAAGHIKGLVESKPSDKDLLEIEAKEGLVPFLRLRNVNKWFADKKTDADARQNVEALIKMVSAALQNELGNRERITKYAKNLLATPEEAAFALRELIRSGVDAIPVLIDLLRSDQAPGLRGAVLDALPQFDVSAVPALVASLDVDDPGMRMQLLESLRRRPDYALLPARVETDFIPHLWYFTAELPRNPEILRKKAREMLRELLDRDPDVDRNLEHRQAPWRLTQNARKFLEHKAHFTTPVNVFVWKWDGGKPVVAPMSISDAEEYFGLRSARWALEIKPDFDEAQRVFLTLALDKQFARAGQDIPLAKSNPNLDAILLTAPYSLVAELLENAMSDRRPAMAVALIQVLGDRTEVKASRPSDRGAGAADLRPSLLMKALDYPDRRVQFAAADALLKSPAPHTHQRGSQIIKILSGWLLADPPEPGEKPKVMLGDRDPTRAQAVANIVRQAGFSVVIRGTGKEVMRRLQEKADIDLVLIDHHLQLPAFSEFLSQMRADLRTRGIPVAVIASPETQTTAHPLTLLARLAALTAAEEHLDNISSQQQSYEPRRDAPSYRFKQRLDALRKLVESAGIEVSNDVADRLEYLVFMTTPPNPMGFPADKPELEKSRLIIPAGGRLNRINSLRLDPKRGHIAAGEPPFSNTAEHTPVLAEVAARHENGLPQEALDLAKYYWDVMQQGQMEKDGSYAQLPLPAPVIRHPEIEAKLNRLTKGYRNIRVIPEFFTDIAFKDEMQEFAALREAKVLEMEKKTNARIALEWLRRMAIGELPGYSVVEAEAALRQSLQKPELVALAIDAVGRLASKEAQQDLASVVIGPLPPEPRAQAADALIKHIQQRGKMISPPQEVLLADKITSEESPEVKTRLLALKGILSSSPKETGARLLGYTPSAVAAPKEDGTPEPKKKD